MKSINKSTGIALAFFFLAIDFLTGIENPLTMMLETLPGEQWMQRETEYFQIIHTATLSEKADFLAMVLDDIFETINADLIPAYPKKKWPLIISDVGMTANGFVALFPRRSVWYTSPIADDYISTRDWLLTLARHETRHLGQFDFGDRGTTHVLSILFGETGTAIGLIFSYPLWFIEGDAVYIESIYSNEGRGRDPMFLRNMALIALEKPDIIYSRIASTSLGEYHPDWYRLGYEIVRWLRKNYTDESISILAEKLPEIGLPLIALDAGMKKATKLKPREVYKKMIDDLAEETRQFKKANTWSDAEVLGKGNRWYTTWNNIFVDKGTVFAVRYINGEAPALIRILPDGTEKKIMPVPGYGGISMVPIMHKGKQGYRIIWSSYRPYPLSYNIRSVDITVTDISADGRRWKRFHPKTGTRLTSPKLSPDGTLFAAVEYPKGDKCRIVILETDSGSIVDEIALPAWTSTSSATWSASGDRLVFVLRTAQGRQLTEWLIGSKELQPLAPPTADYIKFPVYTPDEKEVVYSGNTGGIESIWAINRETGETRNIVRRWYTASKPSVSPDGQWLYFAEYSSSMGEQLARIPLSSTISEAPIPPAGYVNIENKTRPPVPNSNLYDTETKRTQLAEAGKFQYPAKQFKPLGHGLRLHSWGFMPDINNLQNLLLGMQFSDLLGTMNMHLGGLFNYTENAPGAFARLNFSGFRPNINIDTTYLRRSTNKAAWNTVSGAISFSFPIILSRNGISSHTLRPRIEAAAEWSDRVEPAVKPLLDYSLNWRNVCYGGTKAFRPELGWTFQSSYAHYPIDTGDMVSVDLRLHLPGGFRNTFLTLRGAAERQTNEGAILSKIGKPRGYIWTAPEFLLKSTIDYEFPLFYPELPLGSAVYIQRFRFNLHSDFAWTANANYLWEKGEVEELWSSGLTLYVDLAILNYLSGLSFGFRVDWLWRDKTAVFSFDIETNIPFVPTGKNHTTIH